MSFLKNIHKDNTILAGGLSSPPGRLISNFFALKMEKLRFCIQPTM